MQYFLEIGEGKWFPLDSFAAGPDHDPVVAFSLDSSLSTQGDDMAEALESALDRYVEEKNHEAFDSQMHTESLVDWINRCFGDKPLPGDFAPFAQLSPAILAQIMLQFLGPNPDALSDRDRIAAAEFANVLGPDWSQKLYHFAVKVTKIAG